MTRQKILITGASSGLGAGMARSFAAKGRDLALCARLEQLVGEATTAFDGFDYARALERIEAFFVLPGSKPAESGGA